MTKHAPIYTTTLNDFHNQITKAVHDTQKNLLQYPTLSVLIEDATCTVQFKEPQYDVINSQYVLKHITNLNINSPHYNLTVEVDNNSNQVHLNDTKTNNTIYTIAFNLLDSLTHQADINEIQTNFPYIKQVLNLYQVQKHVHVPHNTKQELTLNEVLKETERNIRRHLKHIVEREKQIPSTKDMNDITEVLQYFSELDNTEINNTTNLKLQVQAEVNNITYIVNINDNITVDIIDQEDANIVYEVRYEYDSPVLAVMNKRFNNLVYSIPTFIMDNTRLCEDELTALRNTYKLYDATQQAYRVLQYFYNKGTNKVQDKAYDIKQDVYSAIGTTIKV